MARYKPKKKMEFSKKLAVINTVVYLGVLLFSLMFWVLRSNYPESILGTATAQYATTLSVYMIKAGVENYQKINVYKGEEYNEHNNI